MPLLWQHVQAQPIGKMLKVLRHDKDSLIVLSAIMDVNQLAADSAKMVEAGMLRISHGFKALEAVSYEEESQAEPGVMTPPPGLEIRAFEIMEESVVSVPSNVDAVITMYSSNQLSDPLAKNWAKQFYSSRPVQTCGCSFEDEKKPDPSDEGDGKPADVESKEVDLSRTDGMVEEAKRALEWMDEFGRAAAALGRQREGAVIAGRQ